MPLIVDTWNVLHITGVLPPELAGLDLVGLINLIGESRYRTDQVTLVCDGAAPPEIPERGGSVGKGVTVRYSGPGREADDLIQQMIRSSSIPRRLTVVSSDHAIIRAARKRRCQCLRSESFLANLSRDAGRPGPLPRADTAPGGLSGPQVEQWKSLFAIDEAEAQSIEREIERRLPRRKRSGTQPISPQSRSTTKASRDSKSGAESDTAAGSARAPSGDEPRDLPEHAPPLPRSIIEEAEALAREVDEMRRRSSPPSPPDDGTDV